MKTSSLIKWYCLALFAADGATGILLMTAPVFTLKLMHIPQVPAELVWLRWLGAFVFSTAIYYVLPFRRQEGLTVRLDMMLELTAAVRLVVAAFVLTEVFLGSLHPAWLSVAAFDASAAIFQIVIVSKRWLRHG